MLIGLVGVGAAAALTAGAEPDTVGAVLLPAAGAVTAAAVYWVVSGVRLALA